MTGVNVPVGATAKRMTGRDNHLLSGVLAALAAGGGSLSLPLLVELIRTPPDARYAHQYMRGAVTSRLLHWQRTGLIRLHEIVVHHGLLIGGRVEITERGLTKAGWV